MAQSSNDSSPSAISIAAAVNVKERLIPTVTALRDGIAAKAQAWTDIVKIGRTHMQDATPPKLGQEWAGYAGMLADDLERIEAALQGVYRLRREVCAGAANVVRGDVLVGDASCVGWGIWSTSSWGCSIR
jgi:fumarate hydratase class II